MSQAEEISRVGLYFGKQRAGRLPAQQRAGLAGVARVLAHGFEIRILAAEMVRRVLMATAQLRVEPPHRPFVETRRLRHQVVARGEQRYPLAAARRAEAAEHELRIKAVAAFLEITAVGHLRDDVRGAEHL